MLMNSWMRRWIGAGLCLAAWGALRAARADTAPADFSRYQAILDRQPFGEIAPPEAAATGEGEEMGAAAASAALTDFELKAIIDEGGALQAGFLDKRTSKHVYLSVGQLLDGLELISLNYEAEEAVLQRDSETVVLKLRPVQPEEGAEPAEAPAAERPAERPAPFGLRDAASGVRRPFFSDRRRPFAPFQPGGTNGPFQPRSLESFFRPVTNGVPPFVSPFRPVGEPGSPAVAPGFPFVPVPAAEAETPDNVPAPAPAFPMPVPEGADKEESGGDTTPAPNAGGDN